MSGAIYGIYGSSGFGREVMPLAREQLGRLSVEPEQIYFIDDNKTVAMINAHPVVTYEEFKALKAEDKKVAIAIANSQVREKLASTLTQDGIAHWPVMAGSVVSMDSVIVGHGALLCPFVTLTANIQIGDFFHANLYSYVAHDCVIGDYVTFAPRVSCNGNIIIEDHVYVGTGAVIKQGSPDKPLRIGKGAIIGMGAVVTKDVPAGVTVVGNPARIFQK